MNNWKSLLAFILFIAAYAYAIIYELSDDKVETTGLIALFSMLFMMLRSDKLTEITVGLVEALKSKFK